ncbi:fungal-specific transcription factor domain-containing protein [Penicillium rubens]|uniref:Fungal-specific transcription factor domain-containing protein n=1 Tax=Penicillium chrysogenum TaxID=5076 RepID=A0ABQ8WW97_PENCH|nr:fungal-specific transcription factor domain-containing protein [Penicillium rubens]KAJ5265215.1 fungal-specific transcription factor domain-containing protein [Penicillium chrysogenum]KAJ5283319.1 fungal-specific transcription factor domain-containing protein [Penicillium chrysogenum]KAJ5829165.1 fungal-specific transcription factor domain-containing protein [Penicillium rubens]
MDSRGKPPLHLAQLLIGQCFPTAHRYSPVIDEMSFLRKFGSAYDVTSDPAPAKSQWLMNLLFAISAKYCEAMQADSMKNT